MVALASGLGQNQSSHGFAGLGADDRHHAPADKHPGATRHEDTGRPRRMLEYRRHSQLGEALCDQGRAFGVQPVIDPGDARSRGDVDVPLARGGNRCDAGCVGIRRGDVNGGNAMRGGHQVNGGCLAQREIGNQD